MLIEESGIRTVLIPMESLRPTGTASIWPGRHTHPAAERHGARFGILIPVTIALFPLGKGEELFQVPEFDRLALGKFPGRAREAGRRDEDPAIRPQVHQ